MKIWHVEWRKSREYIVFPPPFASIKNSDNTTIKVETHVKFIVVLLFVPYLIILCKVILSYELIHLLNIFLFNTLTIELDPSALKVRIDKYAFLKTVYLINLKRICQVQHSHQFSMVPYYASLNCFSWSPTKVASISSEILTNYDRHYHIVKAVFEKHLPSYNASYFFDPSLKCLFTMFPASFL